VCPTHCFAVLKRADKERGTPPRLNAQGQRAEWLRWPTTTRKPWYSSNRVPLCQATLSIGPYLLLEGPNPTKTLYPARRRITIQIQHATLSLPRALRGWIPSAYRRVLLRAEDLLRKWPEVCRIGPLHDARVAMRLARAAFRPFPRPTFLAGRVFSHITPPGPAPGYPTTPETPPWPDPEDLPPGSRAYLAGSGRCNTDESPRDTRGWLLSAAALRVRPSLTQSSR
jgi:hypothetical protein